MHHLSRLRFCHLFLAFLILRVMLILRLNGANNSNMQSLNFTTMAAGAILRSVEYRSLLAMLYVRIGLAIQLLNFAVQTERNDSSATIRIKLFLLRAPVSVTALVLV